MVEFASQTKDVKFVGEAPFSNAQDIKSASLSTSTQKVVDLLPK